MSHAIVVMGVSGCGKSTLGVELAAALGVPFIEGDDLHPPANVAKMRRGIPLDDRDREPFLIRVAAALAAARPAGAVVSCSALKRSYRDLLRSRVGKVIFVWPRVEHEVLVERLAQRSGHYMPPSLLDSQFAALEPPAKEEHAIVLDGRAPIAMQVAAVQAALDDRAALQAARV